MPIRDAQCVQDLAAELRETYDDLVADTFLLISHAEQLADDLVENPDTVNAIAPVISLVLRQSAQHVREAMQTDGGIMLPEAAQMI